LDQRVETFYRQGQYREALLLAKESLLERFYLRALNIHKKVFGLDSVQAAISYHRLGTLYDSKDRYEEAETQYRHALDIREKILGPKSKEVAQSLYSLAMLYHVRGQYDRAKPLHQRAFAIREAVLTVGHPEVAQSLNSLAVIFQAQERFAEAESLYTRALSLRKNVAGTDLLDVAQSLNNLGLKQALLIHLNIYGKDHPHVANSLRHYAALLKRTQRTTLAKRFAAHADAIDTNK